MDDLNPQVDHYIEQAAEFAKPVLLHLRKLVHQAVPDICETIKWGLPTFEHKGIVCHIASFKKHCSFVIKHADSLYQEDVFGSGVDSGMGNFGKLQSLKYLPADEVIISCVQQAAQLNQQGIKSGKGKTPKPALPMPEDFAGRLASNSKTQKIFDAFAPGYQRDYIEWITDAKTDKTRNRRLETALQWISEGKNRNWKYKT